MSNRRLRIAFFGTPEFAVPTLERLLEGPHPVVAVVTQPDRSRGRGRQRSSSPVAQAALPYDVPVLRPERVAEPAFEEELRARRPDLGVVVAFGQFIPRRIREVPSLGYLINGHASLLPHYRGAAPIQAAILGGEGETGVTVMRVEKEMDAGDTALVKRIAIGPDENAGELTERLAQLAAEAIVEAVDLASRGVLHWTPQDHARASYAPRISKEDSRLDWSEEAEALVMRVRAMAPRPGAFAELDGETLRILAAGSAPGPCDAPPGTVRRGEDPPLRIATGEGWLVPRVLQRAGGRPLEVDAFLRGRRLEDGTRLSFVPRDETP